MTKKDRIKHKYVTTNPNDPGPYIGAIPEKKQSCPFKYELAKASQGHYNENDGSISYPLVNYCRIAKEEFKCVGEDRCPIMRKK